MKFKKTMLILLASLALAACGGGGDGTSSSIAGSSASASQPSSSQPSSESTGSLSSAESSSSDSAISSSVHEHTYSDEWSHDETNHWHAATCGHDAKKDEAAHTFGELSLITAATETTDGQAGRKCSVCGYIADSVTIPAGGISELSGTEFVSTVGQTITVNATLSWANLDSAVLALQLATFTYVWDEEGIASVSAALNDEGVLVLSIASANTDGGYAVLTINGSKTVSVTYWAVGGEAGPGEGTNEDM